MLSFINWRIWAAGALALFLVGTHWKAYTAGKATVTAAWNAERLSVAKQSLKLSEEATRTSVDLQSKSEATQKAKDAKIQKLNLAVAAALDSLRNRPERPTEINLPTNSAIRPSCTGSGLYRPDAEFLVREAERADQLRADLAQCQAAYNAARDSLTTKE